MKGILIGRIIPLAIGLLQAALLYFWIRADSGLELEPRIPGLDNAPKGQVEEEGPVMIAGKLEVFDGVPAELAGAWPGFRGGNRDGVSTADTVLARSWPREGPKALWSVAMGEGYAGAAVLAGRVYVIDYDQKKKADAIRCFSLNDGKEIWRYSYPLKVKRNHGMSRTVPAVTEKYIVTIGPKCHVTCLDSMTGKFRWMINLIRQFKTKVPLWYAGQCPLIEDGKVILAPGGDALLMAVDCETGEIIWQTPNPRNWAMTHSSILPYDFQGDRMYVYCAGGGVVGVSPETGAVLWETIEWKLRTNVPTPVDAGDGMIFLCAGYQKGSMMIRLVREEKAGAGAGAYDVQTVFRLEPEVFGSDQQTPVFFNGHIYGVRPDGQLICLDREGNVLWTSSSANRFGLGPYMIAGGMIYVMDDDGLLTVAEASSMGFVPLAKARVLPGPESWGPMAIVAGRLIVRDLEKMTCLDVSGE